MKKIEKANIETLYDKMLTKDIPIVSIMLDFQDSCASQGTDGYTGEHAVNFIKNLITILNVKDKSQLEGEMVSVCTEFYQILAIGNKEENKWIDLKKVDEIIEGNIIEYLKSRERNINDEIER